MEELEKLLNSATTKQLFSFLSNSLLMNFTELGALVNIVRTREIMTPELSIQFVEKVSAFLDDMSLLMAKQVVANANEPQDDDFNPSFD